MSSSEDNTAKTSSPEDSKDGSYAYAIFFITLIFAAFAAFLPSLQLVLSGQASLAFLTASVDWLGGFSTISLISYLLFPVLFFALLYLLDAGIDVERRYSALALSLFVGGASGSLVGSLVGLYYRLIVTPAGSAISPSILGLEPILVGLSAFFSGFSAIALSNFRKKIE